MEPIEWAWQNDITIYPVPIPKSNGKKLPDCHIEVDYRGKKIKGQMIYKQNDGLYNKIKELYKCYFDKR